MDTKDEIAAMERKVQQATQEQARAEARREQAKDALRKDLAKAQEQFGVKTPGALKEKQAELQARLDEIMGTLREKTSDL